MQNINVHMFLLRCCILQLKQQNIYRDTAVNSRFSILEAHFHFIGMDALGTKYYSNYGRCCKDSFFKARLAKIW